MHRRAKLGAIGIGRIMVGGVESAQQSNKKRRKTDLFLAVQDRGHSRCDHAADPNTGLAAFCDVEIPNDTITGACQCLAFSLSLSLFQASTYISVRQ